MKPETWKRRKTNDLTSKLEGNHFKPQEYLGNYHNGLFRFY